MTDDVKPHAEIEAPGATQPAPEPDAIDTDLGVYSELGALPPATLITEKGLARLLGKCRASIKGAIDRGEVPYPARIMGKPMWTAGCIVRFIEAKIERETAKITKLKY